MELYQNQVTRTQGPFSLRMFHRSWGLMLIQANISAPCTVLDFPTLDRFVQELRTNQYDIIGISSIWPNIGKVRVMCDLIRRWQPRAKIVVGGHIANVLDLGEKIDADIIVQGEGAHWFRRYLGENENALIRHPMIPSAFGTRNVGISVREQPGDVAATLIPSVGCPMGCNFCSTSAMFGGQGKCIHFYQTGDQLFDIMCQLEWEMGVQSFFVMDENFLLHRERAMDLLKLMEANDKSWSLYVFSSANVIRSYTMDQLVRLGISWVWMGLEGKNSQYGKLRGIDTFDLIRDLQSHGIRVMGSTIIAMDEHTPKNIDAAIDYAVCHDTDFHQFMLYTPAAGTPLHAELTARGLMKDESEFNPADVHGQFILNYRHPNIPAGAESEMLVRAFNRDFAVNGPSVVRVARTTLAGLKRYRNHPDARIRRRILYDARGLSTTYSAMIAATRLYYRHNTAMHAKMSALLGEMHRVLGFKSRLASLIGGPFILYKIWREEARLAAGWKYEPKTFCEGNAAAVALHPELTPCRFVTPSEGHCVFNS
jgi:radical SAM superfamily enzyme YgiQ (UPF0313 family)